MADDDHEMRTLRWKLKLLAKQNGRQGNTIHQLRTALAEVREITGKVARGTVRHLERTVEEQDAELAKLAEANAELREKLTASDAVTTDGAPHAEDLEEGGDGNRRDSRRRPQPGDPDYVSHRTLTLNGNTFRVVGRSGKTRFTSHEYHDAWEAKRGAKAYAAHSRVAVRLPWA